MTKSDYINNTDLLKSLPVFYQPWYLDIFGVEWDLVWGATPGSRWVFPYFKERRFIFSLSRPQALNPYYGPFPVEAVGASWQPAVGDLAGLSPLLRKNAETVLAPYPGFEFGALKALGFSAKPRVTYLLDLTVPEVQLSNNIEKKHRRAILKGEEELTLKEGIFDLEKLVLWMNHAYEKRGTKYRLPTEFVRKYVRAVLDNKAGIALTAVDSRGEARSMILVLLDPGTENAYYIIAANSFTEPHNAANTYLIWQGILMARQQGYKRFDFEGSSIPGIARFFAKFGGTPVRFAHWQYTHSWLWKVKQKLLG
ncbi:MAG: GNAT family N-acetyltransferase [Sphingobacteriales bacterium]|nr:MAG: GNAT family N-acetyltransferase [Sphingobacteriales bacterium]